jgi:hypothetical protein
MRPSSSRSCCAASANTSRATPGRPFAPSSRISGSACRRQSSPSSAINPYSVSRPRTRLANAVLSSTYPCCRRCTASTACCSTDLIGTKRHLRPAHRFAYRSGVIRVVLAALAIRRGELGSHDAWIVTELAQLARRMLRPRTCFHSHNARRQLRKHFEHLSSAHRLSQHRVAVLICTVHREHALCQVETDGSNLDGASSSQRLDLNPLPIWHNRCRSSRGGHSIRSTGRAGAGLLLGERRWRRTG